MSVPTDKNINDELYILVCQVPYSLQGVLLGHKWDSIYEAEEIFYHYKKDIKLLFQPHISKYL